MRLVALTIAVSALFALACTPLFRHVSLGHAAIMLGTRSPIAPRPLPVPARISVRQAHRVRSLDLEDYVARVLQEEAREFQNPEALQAMAVAVRTYAVQNARRHGAAGLCDGEHCQRLGGAAEERMLKAAEATRGEVIWYRGRPASVFYHENCGGVTASAANVWGGHALPYLVSRRDPYCERQPGLWRTRITKASLARVMASPVLHNDVPMVPVMRQLRILGRTASGRVSAVSWGSEIWSGTRFRDLMSGMATVRSARFDIVDSGDSLTLVGRGAGHGVGLCQHGTAARAEAGQDYREILAAYFPGTTVAPRP